jgi:hypothetical protein
MQLAANPAIALYPPPFRATAQAVLRFTLQGDELPDRQGAGSSPPALHHSAP